jgi:hypothetical protein
MFVRDNVVCSSLVLALALCVSMPGCKKAGESTSPGMADGGVNQAPGDSADPVAELAALEGRMRALGLPVAGGERDEAGEAGEAGMAEGEDDGMSEAEAPGGGGDVERAPAEEAPAPAPSAQVDTSEPPRDAKDLCGDLCSLSESICTLEVRICSLAESHANDSLYADACERAVEDCDVAGEACDGCG